RETEGASSGDARPRAGRRALPRNAPGAREAMQPPPSQWRGEESGNRSRDTRARCGRASRPPALRYCTFEESSCAARDRAAQLDTILYTKWPTWRRRACCPVDLDTTCIEAFRKSQVFERFRKNSKVRAGS